MSEINGWSILMDAMNVVYAQPRDLPERKAHFAASISGKKVTLVEGKTKFDKKKGYMTAMYILEDHKPRMLIYTHQVEALKAVFDEVQNV